MKTARQLIELADKIAPRLFKMQGGVRAMWHGVKANGESLFIGSPSKDKDVAAALVRAAFELNDVVAYVFFDEAFVLELPISTPEDEIQRIMAAGPRNHPDAVDCLVYQAEDANGLVSARRRIVNRELGPLEFDPEASLSEGRLVGLLPKPKGRVQ